MTKLSRVRIDIANDADTAWGIDVRKSSASPPPAVRDRLARLVETIGGSSRRTYERRGTRLTDDNPLPVWCRKTSDEGAAYDLNQEHPTLARLLALVGSEGSADLRRALRLIAASLPLDTLLYDLSSTPRGVSAGAMEDIEVQATAREALIKLIAAGMNASSVGEILAITPPYRDHPDALKRALAEFEDT